MLFKLFLGVKTENNNNDFVKQEPIFDTDFIHHQVPLLDGEVKTEPTEEAEGDSTQAFDNENSEENNEESNEQVAIDILDELIAKAIELSFSKKTDL